MYSLLAQWSKAKQSLGLPLSLAVSAALALPSSALAFTLTHTVPTIQSTFSDKLQSTDRPSPDFPNVKPKPTSAGKASVYFGELSLAGVTLDFTREDVLWTLGEPKARETFPGEFVDEIFYYGGISISFASGRVWDIISTSPKFCTPSGICPGDPVSYVFDTLGPTDIIGQSAVYTAGSCMMDLGLAYNAVNQIQLVCR